MSAICDLVTNYSDEVLAHFMNLPFSGFSSGKGTHRNFGGAVPENFIGK